MYLPPSVSDGSHLVQLASFVVARGQNIGEERLSKANANEATNYVTDGLTIAHRARPAVVIRFSLPLPPPHRRSRHFIQLPFWQKSRRMEEENEIEKVGSFVTGGYKKRERRADRKHRVSKTNEFEAGCRAIDKSSTPPPSHVGTTTLRRVVRECFAFERVFLVFNYDENNYCAV